MEWNDMDCYMNFFVFVGDFFGIGKRLATTNGESAQQQNSF